MLQLLRPWSFSHGLPHISRINTSGYRKIRPRLWKLTGKGLFQLYLYWSEQFCQILFTICRARCLDCNHYKCVDHKSTMEWSSGSTEGYHFSACLVMCASMMPVEELPNASWITAFSLGFLSAVFDNILSQSYASTRDIMTGNAGLYCWIRRLNDMVRSSAGVALTIIPRKVAMWFSGWERLACGCGLYYWILCPLWHHGMGACRQQWT